MRTYLLVTAIAQQGYIQLGSHGLITLLVKIEQLNGGDIEGPFRKRMITRHALCHPRSECMGSSAATAMKLVNVVGVVLRYYDRSPHPFLTSLDSPGNSTGLCNPDLRSVLSSSCADTPPGSSRAYTTSCSATSCFVSPAGIAECVCKASSSDLARCAGGPARPVARLLRLLRRRSQMPSMVAAMMRKPTPTETPIATL